MKPLLFLLAFTVNVPAQSVFTSTAYPYQDFTANVPHIGTATRKQGTLTRCPGAFVTGDLLWTPECGGPTGNFAYNGFSFTSGGLVVDHKVPVSEPTTTILNITSAPSTGYLRIWTSGHGLAQDVWGQGGTNGTRYQVRVTGVNTCTAGASDCGTAGSYTGLWSAAAILYQGNAAMSGTNTFHTASTGQLANGDSVFLWCNNNSDMSYHQFTVSNVTGTAADLDGFSGTLCTASTLFDNMRIDLLSSTRTGTFPTGNPSGTMRKVANGWGVFALTYPHYTLLENRYNFALAGHMPDGVTWNPQANRLRWEITCDYSILFNPNKTSSSIGSGGFNLGTYVKADSSNSNNTYQGVHWYHLFYGNQYAFHRMYFEAMGMVAHTNLRGTTTEAPNDFLYVAPIMDNFPMHYFDALVEFYISWGPLVGGYGNNTTKNAMANGGVCTLTSMTVAAVTGEPDSWVNNSQGTYNGTAYELAWNSRTFAPATTYDLRYSTTGSMHINGWASGTAAGSVSSIVNNGYQNMFFQSAPMSEAGSIWWAIRPHLRIGHVSGSGTSPVVITPLGGHESETGDQIVTTGVTNVPDGTYTITRIPSVSWQPTDGTWTSTTVAAGSGTCTPQCATATVGSTTGIYVGQQIFIYFSKTGGGVGALDTDPVAYRGWVNEIVDATHFKHNTTAAAGVTHTPGCLSTTRICGVMSTFAAMALQGTTGTGTAGPATGAIVTTADTTGFYEMGLPGGTVIPTDNPLTVSPASVTLAASVGGSNPSPQVLTAFCPSGCGTVTSSKDQSWCSVSTVGLATTVSINISGLVPSAYTCNVSIASSIATSGTPTIVPVYLTITPAAVVNTGSKLSGVTSHK